VSSKGLVDKDFVMSRLLENIAKLAADIEKCKEDFSKEWYYQEFSFLKLRKVERKTRYSDWNYENYCMNAWTDLSRMRKIFALACDSTKLYLSPEDHALVLGNYRGVRPYTILPLYAYFKDETK